MKVLIIEDTPDKKAAIKKCITTELLGSRNKASIFDASCFIEAIRLMNQHTFDLIVFDVYLPTSPSEKLPIDHTQGLIQEFAASSNYNAETIALTGVDIEDIDNISAFNRIGVTFVRYDESCMWEGALKAKVSRASQKPKEDFLIFTALVSEREAFTKVDCTLGEKTNIYGMDCQEVKIGSHRGLIIKPSNMGLVNMAIVVSKAIELFQPQIVAMSGICAGVSGESNYLDLLVGKTCWEWQTGKWKEGEFKQEIYQRPASSELEVDLQQSTESQTIKNIIRSNLFSSELKDMKILFVPISSGSAVIADAEKMQQIGLTQRKMAGLEMEMYAMYEAAEQSLAKPLYFGAKSVVDMGNKEKTDDYHEDGCIISARYVASIIQQQLDKN